MLDFVRVWKVKVMLVTTQDRDILHIFHSLRPLKELKNKARTFSD